MILLEFCVEREVSSKKPFYDACHSLHAFCLVDLGASWVSLPNGFQGYRRIHGLHKLCQEATGCQVTNHHNDVAHAPTSLWAAFPPIRAARLGNFNPVRPPSRRGFPRRC